MNSSTHRCCNYWLAVLVIVIHCNTPSRTSAQSDGSQKEARKALNVLFIMADDLRPEIATYGSIAKTPALSQLAARSVQFDKAYCQQSVCNPSRSSMLTGLRPDTLGLWCNGIHFRELKPDAMTLPLWLKQHGYTTRCVGKIFHNWRTTEKGDPRSWSQPEFLHFANHNDDNAMIDGKLPPNLATAPKCECRDVPDEAYYDGRVAAEAVRVLKEVKDETFFLAVGFWKPHAPFNAPKKYWDMYDRKSLPEFNPNRPLHSPDIAMHDGSELRGLPPNQKTFSADETREIRHGYLANVSYMDAQLGKVLRTLDELGLADSTMIVFAGDHGFHLGEHSLWAKTSNYDLDTRVPLMISVPNKTARGQKTQSLAELVDLFPTVVSACELPMPQGLEGKSLLSIVEDPKREVKQAARHQHPRPAYYDREPAKEPIVMGYGVRTSRAHYIEWRDWKTKQVVAKELYDLEKDPQELVNISGTSEAEPLEAEAREHLK